jgi:hypothetical protein
MDWSKLTVTMTLEIILSTALATGCGNTFSQRVANSIEVCADMQSNPSVSLTRFWRSQRRLTLLQTAVKTIKTNGIIDHAVIGPMATENHKVFEMGYLSADANVKEIVIVKGRDVIWSAPQSFQAYAKLLEKDYVVFVEEFVWRTSNPTQGYDVKDLSVLVVKADGSTIGPAQILTDKEVWEEIKTKMLSEKIWQNKYPWLHRRLLENPDMSPLWRDPDQTSPYR